MTDPDLLDAQRQAESLLADAAEAVSLLEQLDVALRQLGEWREAVVAANRLSQEFEARALRAEAALDEARKVGFRQGVEAMRGTVVTMLRAEAEAHAPAAKTRGVLMFAADKVAGTIVAVAALSDEVKP